MNMKGDIRMHSHNKCGGVRHTNAFLELNGVPYLVAEYLDRNTFQQIDRSLIKSNIMVDQSESMRAVIDIAVDDIGMRCSDGLPGIVGNNTKQKNLIKAVGNYAEQFNHQLMTVRRGIVLRVNYSLENMRTGETIRSTVEDFIIRDRSYFLDINPRDLNDNAIIVNFSSSMVSTMASFTHGTDQMRMRINEVQMFYEALGNGPNVPRPKMVMSDFQKLPTTYMDSFTHYQYQMKHQNHHCWDPHTRNPFDWGGNYGREPVDMISPSGWTMFNRYYHFDNKGKDIILHEQEVRDPMAPIALVPCGTIRVNRTFMINPGHRIIFKFCIWKNDLVVVNDSTMIARAIKTPFIADFGDIVDQDCNCGCEHGNIHQKPSHDCGCDHEVEPDKETILRMLAESQRMNNKQNFVINQLTQTVEDLQAMMKQLVGIEKPPCTDPSHTKATVGDMSFKTIQDAISAIEDGTVKGEITLMDNVEESLVIKGDVTIDLNGHDITAPVIIDSSAYHHTIMVDGGNLVINGEGTVSNSNYQGYCIMNLAAGDTWTPGEKPGESMGEGTVILNGGKFIHNSDDPNHRAHVIVNHGARMTINDGVEVDTMLDDSSLVNNGFQSDPIGQPIMIINGGKFRGGRHTINNDHGGRMIINGGKFRMGTPWPDVDFASGPKNVFCNEVDSTAQIKGGAFFGNMQNNNTSEKALQISGGKFSVDVSDFLVEGMKQQNDGTVVPE